MLSDDSSSDSETGRFKGSSEKKESNRKHDLHRDNKSSRSRPEDNRYRRDVERRERNRFGRRSQERSRHSRQSPRRRRSPDRRRSSGRQRSSEKRKSLERRSFEKRRSRDRREPSQERHLTKKNRSNSRDKKRESLSRKSSERKRVVAKIERESCSDISDSPEEYKSRSAVHRPSPMQKRKTPSPVEIIPIDEEEEEKAQPASYYNTIPIEEESIELSETDSSDDERLRAKLLNLEKELIKTRKKKHRKKHKKRDSKDKKDREIAVEVTSTTDIDTKEICLVESDTPEVSSTQKSRKEGSEEGEISSDSEAKEEINMDAEDLRHKLNRDKCKAMEVCGPALPPHLHKRLDRSISPQAEGPALPPHLKNRERNIGPTMPHDLREVLSQTEHIRSSSSEDEGIGPIPVGSQLTDAHQRLEERALDMKIRKLDGHSLSGLERKKREAWMTELPEGKAKYLGLEARQFRAKEGPDMSDRSGWTDTPEEKARKAEGIPKEEDSKKVLQREARAKHITDRDADQEHAVKKHKKKHKREESLLDMHQKKINKKKKKGDKDDEREERRPFSRDVDLQVNRFDEAQKKSIIKKAQHLDTRFSRGEAKYL